MSRFLNNLTGIGHVVIEFKVLDDFHGAIAPFLGTAHELLEHFPFGYCSGEVHVVY